MKHNYYCTVASLCVTKLTTWCLKCYTAVAFQFLQIEQHIISVMPKQRGMGKGQCIHAITGTEGG